MLPLLRLRSKDNENSQQLQCTTTEYLRCLLTINPIETISVLRWLKLPFEIINLGF